MIDVNQAKLTLDSSKIFLETRYSQKEAYTGWTILIHPVEYLENQARERKIFQTKVL